MCSYTGQSAEVFRYAYPMSRPFFVGEFVDSCTALARSGPLLREALVEAVLSVTHTRLLLLLPLVRLVSAATCFLATSTCLLPPKLTPLYRCP